jgi:hypothetical protein
MRESGDRQWTGVATGEELAANQAEMDDLRGKLQPVSWEETPAQAGRADRDHWTDRDWNGDYDDPSDRYYY